MTLLRHAVRRPMALAIERFIARPQDAALVPLLIGVLARGLLLACGVTLFVVVAASDGQVIDVAWQVLMGR